MKEMDNVTLMQKAKAQMLIRHVFFATLVLGTELREATERERKDIKTAATDMKSIIYNPEFIEGLDVEVVTFVLAHEVAHIMFKHGLRRAGRAPRRWNHACDFAINLMLKDCGFKLWERCLCDEKYRDMSAEQIYEQREKEREDWTMIETLQKALDPSADTPETIFDVVEKEFHAVFTSSDDPIWDAWTEAARTGNLPKSWWGNAGPPSERKVTP